MADNKRFTAVDACFTIPPSLMFVEHLLAPSYHIIASEDEEQGLPEICGGTNSGFGALLFTFFW